jgi:hypothetical protein
MEEKPVTVPLGPPQISHGLSWDRTRASTVTGRRLTTSLNNVNINTTIRFEPQTKPSVCQIESSDGKRNAKKLSLITVVILWSR